MEIGLVIRCVFRIPVYSWHTPAKANRVKEIFSLNFSQEYMNKIN